MIAKLLEKIKSAQYHIFLAICIILISFISYDLGKIASHDKGQLKITQDANIYKAASAPVDDGLTAGREETGDRPITRLSPSPKTTPKPLDLRVVVSKASDSKKYHYSWCGSWKKIKAENQLWFSTEQEAITAGYTLAGNCSK